MRNPVHFMVAALTSLVLSWSAFAEGREVDYHYEGDIAIEPDTGFIKAFWSIEVRDPADERITFFVKDTVEKPVIEGADVVGIKIERQEGFAKFWAIEVDLKPATDAPRNIHINYEGVLIQEPLPHNINTISSEIVELNVDSFWFPIDSRFSKTLSSELMIHMPPGWQGVTTGDLIVDGSHVLIDNTDPRIDIAFTLAKNPRLTKAGGFEIFDLRETGSGIAALGETATACMTELNARFGQTKPLPKAKLVVTSRDQGGYARENYIVLTDIGDTPVDRLTQFICHEFAHYWASGADFNSVENWLNEAFAEYAGFVGVRAILGEEAFTAQRMRFAAQIKDKELPPIWTEGTTERGPYLVQYRKAPLMLAEFEQQVGRDRFEKVVQAFFGQPVKTTPQLLKTVADIAGLEARETFQAMLAR